MRRTLNIMPYLKIALIISVLLLCFQTSTYAKDITLEWDANTEPDLDHYVIYWGTYSGTYPNNSGNIGKSTTTYAVTGLDVSQIYYFSAKAFNTEGLGTDYSNIVSTGDTPTPINSGGGGGGCFIVTAAYGSNIDRHAQILSEFRDKRLANNYLGEKFIALYYTVSPPIADFLARHTLPRTAVKYSLIPITAMAYVAISIQPVVLLFVFILMILTGVCCVRHFSRSRLNISQ